MSRQWWMVVASQGMRQEEVGARRMGRWYCTGSYAMTPTEPTGARYELSAAESSAMDRALLRSTKREEPTGAQADAEQRCPDCNRVLNRCWCADLGKYGAVPRLDRGAPTAEPIGAQADALSVEDALHMLGGGEVAAGPTSCTLIEYRGDELNDIHDAFVRTVRDLEAARGEIADLKPSPAPLPAGFVSVEDWVAELEQDPAMKERLDAARIKLWRMMIEHHKAQAESLRAQLASAAKDAARFNHLQNMPRTLAQALFWQFESHKQRARAIDEAIAALASNAAANKEREP